MNVNKSILRKQQTLRTKLESAREKCCLESANACYLQSHREQLQAFFRKLIVFSSACP